MVYKNHPKFCFQVENAQHALTIIYQAPYLWARPQTMRGSGTAYCWHEDQWKMVPNAEGGEVVYTFSPEHLFMKWEIASPAFIMQERTAVAEPTGFSPEVHRRMEELRRMKLKVGKEQKELPQAVVSVPKRLSGKKRLKKAS